jgi:hypothetical protein
MNESDARKNDPSLNGVKDLRCHINDCRNEKGAKSYERHWSSGISKTSHSLRDGVRNVGILRLRNGSVPR